MILSDAFSVGLTRAASETIDPIQRGGIAGRRLLDNVVGIEWWGLRQWLTGGGRAGSLFTDIRAAFPSLLISWIAVVLATMGVPDEVRGFYAEFYRDNVAVINFPGARHLEFLIGRGVRQGDPASMVLFAYALDPVLRWLRVKIGQHVPLLRGYADDLSFCLPNILTGLQPTLAALKSIERAVGLGLNIRKCKVLVTGTLDPARLMDHLKKKGSEYQFLGFVHAVLYLGFWMGPGALERVWSNVIPKFWMTVRRLRGLGLGLPQTIRLFHSHAMSLLGYQLQLCPITPPLRKAYNEALQVITAGPRHAFSREMLTGLRALGASLECLDLDCYSRATKFRVIMSCSSIDAVQYEMESLMVSLDDDDYIPARSQSGWWQRSWIRTAVKEGSFSVPSSEPIPRHALQKTALRRLKTLRDPSLPLRTLVQRVSKWVGPGRFQVSHFEDLAKRMRAVEKDSTTHLVTGVLRVLCRGVCTSSRLHTLVVGCAFGCDRTRGDDDLCHYRECPKLKQHLVGMFPKAGLISSWSEALRGSDWLISLCCLGPKWGRSRDLIGCAVVDCFLSAHNARRTGSNVSGELLLAARLRQQTRRHPKLHDALRSLRPLPPAAAPAAASAVARAPLALPCSLLALVAP